MTHSFVILKCSNSICGLRFPLDETLHSGKFCPKCGALTTFVDDVKPYNIAPAQPTAAHRNVSAILDNLRSDFNVGSAFRSAIGAGIEHLYLCGITPQPDKNPRIAKTALGAESMLSWTYHPDAVSLALVLKSQGAILISLEATSYATNLFEFTCPPSAAKPLVLIAGSELAGVDPGLLALSDHVLHIPMHGPKGSLNVSVAFGIAAYYLTTQYR